MRKRPIIEDFKYAPTYGTFNMMEKTNFITGKGMDIEDAIRIRSLDVWNLNNDSLTGMKESSIVSMAIAQNQTQADIDTLTQWTLTIDSNDLLREYLYEQIYTQNVNSAFSALTPNYAIDKRPSNSVYAYIDDNLVPRYTVNTFVMWAQYYLLSESQTPGVNPIPLLKQSPVFSFTAKPDGATDAIIDAKSETTAIKSYTDGTLEVSYKQTKSGQYYIFLYYYDIIFNRL